MYTILVLLSLALSGFCFDIDSKSNVAVYWGQNSGGGQERLATYCDSDDVDIFLLSFLYSFPNNLQLDFANMCWDTFPSGLKKCDSIGEDISYCQKKGKLVLLSMGGAVGNYGFSSDSEATKFSQTLWNKFGGGSDDERPFGDAIVDGFDFDFEQNQQTGGAALGKGLRSQFSKDSSRKYYLAAAPQCPYPDASVGNIMEEVDLDFAFIQFYNNYCNLGPNFNWDTWQDYAENTSPNKDIKMFIGQPGGVTGAGSGFNPMSTVSKYISQVEGSKNFGGISLWDASQAFKNNGGETYVAQLKKALQNDDSGSGKLVEKTSSSSSRSSSSSTSSSSTSSTSTASPTTSSSSSSTAVPTTSSTKSSATPSTKSSTTSSTSSSSSSSSTKPKTTESSTTSAPESSSKIEKTPETSNDNVDTVKSTFTTHNTEYSTKVVKGKVLVETITKEAPTTVTTVRYTGTVTEVATKYTNPPDF